MSWIFYIWFIVSKTIPHINKNHFFIFQIIIQFHGSQRRAKSGNAVFSCVCSHIYHIVGSTKRRRVSKIHICQITYGQFVGNCRGNHIQTTVSTFVSCCLSTENNARFLFENKHHAHRFRTRIVACVMLFMNHHGISIQSHITCLLQWKSGNSCHCIKHPNNGSPDRATVRMFSSQYIFCSNAPLTIGRPCKRNAHFFAIYPMFDFHHIAGTVYTWIGCLQEFIHQQSSGFANSKSCILRQLQGRAYTDRKQHHICIERWAVV